MEKSLKQTFNKDILIIKDIDNECKRIINNLQDNIFHKLYRNGAVVGISGGIDSSVCMALAAKAVGADKVTGIMMPEKDSSADSTIFAQKLARTFGVSTIEEDMTETLRGFKCYERRDEAVKKVFPEYNPASYKMKIGVNQSGLYSNLPPLFQLTIIDKDGNKQSKRLPADAFRQIVGASNFKQRSRMSMLYYHAERLHYAVVGTPNKHEVRQGFFVKHGDGAADVMPIAYLFKTQVYQLAKYLGVPQEIIDRTPTTDTYSAEQTQEEFFYQLPFEQLDLLWYAFENNYDPAEVGKVMDIKAEDVKSVFTNFARKIKTTEYLRMAPIREENEDSAES